MLRLPEEADVLERLTTWARKQPPIRAVVLTSSRAKPGAPTDALSDYDVILFVTEPEAFAVDRSWQSALGRPAARWSDRDELYGLQTLFRGVVYENGLKVDYSVWPDRLLDLIAAQPAVPDRLDVGYRVLLDKDGRTDGWQPPTYRAHIPAPPTPAEYEALVEEFWWDTTYVAKGLWRGEVFHAKWALDADAKYGALRRMLEWRLELDHAWSLKPGAYGRGLERLLPADVWAGLAATFVGTEVDENWDALFRTTALFRRVATELGDALGYDYPHRVDETVTALLIEVRALPRDR